MVKSPFNTIFYYVLLVNVEILPPRQPPNNQIAILCSLTVSHVTALKLAQAMPMESSPIMAHTFFAASKLDDSPPIIFVRPEFFSSGR